jgi:hypothetical protein
MAQVSGMSYLISLYFYLWDYLKVLVYAEMIMLLSTSSNTLPKYVIRFSSLTGLPIRLNMHIILNGRHSEHIM